MPSAGLIKNKEISLKHTFSHLREFLSDTKHINITQAERY